MSDGGDGLLWRASGLNVWLAEAKKIKSARGGVPEIDHLQMASSAWNNIL